MESTAQFEKHGYAILRNFFDNKEISVLSRHIDRIYQKWKQENEVLIFENKLVNMHSLTSRVYFQECPQQRIAFFELIAPEKLTGTLEKIFGPGIYFHNTQLFFNPSNFEQRPYWHRDMQYSSVEDSVQRDEQNSISSLHVRIPLIPERGVELVAGTHRRWDNAQERNVRLELNGHKNSEPLPDSHLVDLDPGDILIFDAQMIHRGNYELNPERKAFDLCVGKYHPLTSSFLDPQVLPTDKEIEQISNNGWYKLAKVIAQKNHT